MNLVIKPSTLKGTAVAPISKSIGHRALIATFLAGENLALPLVNDDLSATANCLNALRHGGDVLDAGESGSTLRFLLPVVCALGRDVTFTGRGRLGQRPIDGLIKALTEGGARITAPSGGGFPLSVSGKLKPGDYRVDGSISSQYVSGLLFALPLLDGDSRLFIDGAASESYIKLTVDALRRFSILIDKTEYGYYINGGGRYVAPSEICIEGDWSSASFLLVAGALSGEVAVSGLSQNSIQGDKIVYNLLKSAGCDIAFKDGAYIAKKSCLTPIEFDASDCPDLVPVMAVALSYADGVSKISGVDRLKFKESDRLIATQAVLRGFGIKAQARGDVLEIFGNPRHIGSCFNSFNDHRIAMSAAIGALCADGDSEILGADCIKKSYPDFAQVIKDLGADVSVVL